LKIKDEKLKKSLYSSFDRTFFAFALISSAIARNRIGLLFIIPSKILVKQSLLALLFTSYAFFRILL
jgi:hypothetical protein